MPAHATFTVPHGPGLYISNNQFSTPRGSCIPHILLALIIPISLASPCFRFRNEIFVAIILSLVITTQIDPHFTDNHDLAQLSSQLWAFWLAGLEKLINTASQSQSRGKGFLSPESIFWRLSRAPQKAEQLRAFGWPKICWALALCFNLRGVRWNYEVKNIPELTRGELNGKARFLMSRSLMLAYCFLMADIVNNVWMRLFYAARDGASYTPMGDVNSKFLTVGDPDLRWRFVKCLFWGQLPYYMMQFQYNAISIFAVAFGLSQPEDWPSLFGSISEVTTVRTFWGRFWHQWMRKAFTTFGGHALDSLGIPRGTKWSSQTQIWLAFLMSSVLHAQQNLITIAPGNISFSERTLGMFQFFLWQAAAISFENFVQWAWPTVVAAMGTGDKHCALELWARMMIGRLWVVLSFFICIPWAADLTLRFRFGADPMLPFTVVGPAVERVFSFVRG